jgi:NAD(P)H-dependent FMN reductase
MTSSPLRLSIVVTSTREGRGGLAVGRWFEEQAKKHGSFTVELIDLVEVGLPLLDERNHPNLRQYEKEHTKAWSARVTAADAFVFVVPEYNYGMPPALLNALDFLYHEWHYKAAAFLSYGGQSGGLRSVQMAKPVLTTLRMMPIPEGVTVQFFSKHMQDDGSFEPGDGFDKPTGSMLDELLRWSIALQTLRSKVTLSRR